MRNQKENRIQNTPEYMVVKRITNQKNRENIIEATKSFAFFMSMFFFCMWIFIKFLLNIDNIILWFKEFNLTLLIIDLMIWIKEIIS